MPCTRYNSNRARAQVIFDAIIFAIPNALQIVTGDDHIPSFGDFASEVNRSRYSCFSTQRNRALYTPTSKMLRLHFASRSHRLRLSREWPVCRHCRSILSTRKVLHSFKIVNDILRNAGQKFRLSIRLQTREMIGFRIGAAHGIAVEFILVSKTKRQSCCGAYLRQDKTRRDFL
jgi:hypothetical protein